MECEWDQSEDAIRWDFDKLVVAKADHKLVVFNQRTLESVKWMMEKLLERIRHFDDKLPGERYLMAGYYYENVYSFYFEACAVSA